MLSGDIRSKVDAFWNVLSSGGIANPIELIKQVTYPLFLKRLDDLPTLEGTNPVKLSEGIYYLSSWSRLSRLACCRRAMRYGRNSGNSEKEYYPPHINLLKLNAPFEKKGRSWPMGSPTG
jgi:hypothetical protein